jgi:lysophospholipase L1-like esterase
MLLGCLSTPTVAGEPIKIMPLGDSITTGVSSTNVNGYRKPLYLNLTNSSYDVNFVGSQNAGDFDDTDHEGHNGWHAAGGTDGGLLPNVYDWLAANPAEIVLLHIGTNDITDANQDVNEVNDILDEIDRFEVDSNEVITVVLALIINRQTYSAVTTQFNNGLNTMALNRIAGGDDIIIVDMENALNYLTDMADELHPNNSGYAKMADVWYEALNNYFTPTIASTPITNASVGLLYTYDVNATGYPDPNYYVLLEHPTGMTIDHNTGLIEWIPDADGDANVIVEAGNEIADTNQSFTISVITSIKFDAASEASSSSNGSTLSWSHTIGSDNNRILVVGIVGKDNQSGDLVISSVTYNSINMSLVQGSSQSVSGSSTIRAELYYLLDSNLPPSGSYTVEVTYSANVLKRCAGAVSMANVEQQPAEAVDTNSSTSTDFISTNITTQTDHTWLVDVVGCDSSGLFTADVNNGQQQRFDANSNASTLSGSTKIVTSSGQTAMRWTYYTGANYMVHSVAAFAPAMRIISGYIFDPNITPVDGVLVAADPNGNFDTTDSNGYYEVVVSYGWSGTVTPTKPQYLFDPLERTYSNVITDRVGQNFGDITIYDLDGGGFIGWGDVAVISENWLQTGPDVPGDLHRDDDNIVNFLDFAEFAPLW